MTPQIYYLFTLDMQMVFKRNDNKLGFCQCYQWFSGLVYYIEMMGYITLGNLNIRIHRDITCEMWFGVGRYKNTYTPSANEECRCMCNESILVNNYLAIFNSFLFPYVALHLCIVFPTSQQLPVQRLLRRLLKPQK